jgi:hypothetical protein
MRGFPLLLGYLLLLTLTVISTLFFFFLASYKWKWAFYAFPVTFIYILIWDCVKTRKAAMNNIDIVYNFICFFLFGGLFYGLYFTIYAPTFHQKFTAADNCKVIDIQEFVVIGDRKNENYKYLTMKLEHENEVFYGCGCHSDKK